MEGVEVVVVVVASAGVAKVVAAGTGPVTIVGLGKRTLLTFSAAAEVVTVLPATLVKTAWYWLPDSAATAVKEYVVAVAPGILTNEPPLLAFTCHCTLGAGDPVAAAVKLAVVPANTVLLTGLVVTVKGLAGVELTVRVAGFA